MATPRRASGFSSVPGRCASCHPASAPDLSNIGRQFTTAELIRKLRKPSERIAEGYGIVTRAAARRKIRPRILAS
jgi:hypothetical protein